MKVAAINQTRVGQTGRRVARSPDHWIAWLEPHPANTALSPPSEATHTGSSWPQDCLVLSTLPDMSHINMNMSDHLHQLYSTMKSCRFSQFCVFSPPVCLCFLTGPWLAALYGRAAQSSGHRKRTVDVGFGWTWTTGKLAGHTDQRHSLNLFAQPLS